MRPRHFEFMVFAVFAGIAIALVVTGAQWFLHVVDPLFGVHP